MKVLPFGYKHLPQKGMLMEVQEIFVKFVIIALSTRNGFFGKYIMCLKEKTNLIHMSHLYIFFIYFKS